MPKENVPPHDPFVSNESPQQISKTPQEEETHSKRSWSLGEKIVLTLYLIFLFPGLYFLQIIYKIISPKLTFPKIEFPSSPEDVAEGIASLLSGFSSNQWINLLGWVYLVIGISVIGVPFGLLWHPLGFYYYGVYFLIISYLFFAFLVLDAQQMAREKLKTSWTISITLTLTIALVICFSQMCQYLYLVFGGFAAKQTGYWDWLRFGVEQFADNGLFDLPSIYNWHISTIQATSFWSRTIVFLFNIELEIFILAVIGLQFRRLELLRFIKRRKD